MANAEEARQRLSAQWERQRRREGSFGYSDSQQQHHQQRADGLRGKLRRAWLRIKQLVRKHKCLIVAAGTLIFAMTRPTHADFLQYLSSKHRSEVDKLLASALSYLQSSVRSSRSVQNALARLVQYTNLGVLALAKFNSKWFVGALGSWLQLPSALGESVDALKQQQFALDVNALALCNVAVFVLWQTVGHESELMKEHFTASSTNAVQRPHSLLLASLSHSTPLHLLSNLQSLLTVGPHVQAVIGLHNTAALYLFAGIVGSAASVLCNSAIGKDHTRSLGASTSIFGLLAFQAMVNSDVQFVYYGGIVVSAPQLMLAQLLLDVATHAASGLDVFGHAGGALAGYLYYLQHTGNLQPLLPWTV